MSEKSKLEIWRYKTRTGRVVYNRKVHVFRYKDVARILRNLSEDEFTDEYITIEGFGINSAYEILLNSGYAALKNYLARERGLPLGFAGVSEEAFWDRVAAVIQAMVKDMVKRAAEIAAVKLTVAFGVPEEFAEPFVSFIFPYMWDLIDGSLGVLIRGMRGV